VARKAETYVEALRDSVDSKLLKSWPPRVHLSMSIFLKLWFPVVALSYPWGSWFIQFRIYTTSGSCFHIQHVWLSGYWVEKNFMTPPYLYLFLIIYPWKGPWFWQSKFPFFQECFVPSLFKIGPVVSSEKVKNAKSLQICAGWTARWTDGHVSIRKAHLSFQLRLANKSILPILLVKRYNHRNYFNELIPFKISLHVTILTMQLIKFKFAYSSYLFLY
jgi:hypothetical protein